jgi:hypothetical protein
MSFAEESDTSFAYLPILCNKPFGKDDFKGVISEVNGSWIHSAVQALRAKGFQSSSPEAAAIAPDKLVKAINELLPPTFTGFVDEEVLLTTWNAYSAEFAFAIASICRKLVGDNHTKEATKKVKIPTPSEHLPLDFLDILGPLIIKQGLLGAKVVFRKSTDNNAHFDLIYPPTVIKFPEWKEIACDQQEAHLPLVLEVLWGLKNIKLKKQGYFKDEKNSVYSFEYKASWQGGEKSPVLFGSSNDYLKRKVLVWFNYLDSIYSQKMNSASQSIQKAKKVIEEQYAEISLLDEAQFEMQGIVSYLLNKKKDYALSQSF